MVTVQVRQELDRQRRPENLVDAQQFHKERIASRFVLRTPIIRTVSQAAFKQIKDHPKNDIFSYCDRLLETGVFEERTIAFDWAERLHNRYESSDLGRFEKWLITYVDNWSSCDHLCGGTLGFFMLKFPNKVKQVLTWAKSPNRWLRRGSAVTLIRPLREKQQLQTAFAIADRLLLDQDDMVQKGYGWMLKEAANRFENEVFAFVIERKDRMPRTALRYAIEKMPQKKRKQAMIK